MEQPPQQHQLQNQQQPPNDQDNNSGGGKGGSFLCRQSSTRWTPTTDQIRILKELYYTNGLRSPNAEQIHKISARLRQYGKIEGKNVFYWFQNHKARERQKKRLTNDISMRHNRNVSAAPNIPSANWKPEDYSIHNKYSTFTSSGGFSSACPSSSGVFTGGQINGSYGYGSVTMEKSFRECSISSAGANTNVGGSISHNYGGVNNIDPYGSSYTLSFDRRQINSIPALEDYDEDQQEEEEEDGQAEMETLPLFPMNCEEISAFCSFKQNSANCYFRNWYGSDDQYGNSLELSLNSYAGQSQDFI